MTFCDYFFTTSEDANRNLLREGKDPDEVFLVGNLMIDTLLTFGQPFNEAFPRIQSLLTDEWLEVGHNGLSDYGIITLHRPNVDERLSGVSLSFLRGLQPGSVNHSGPSQNA